MTIFMPDWLSVERKELIKSHGAEIILVSREEGGFVGSINKAKELAEKEENSFLANQFSNQDNVLSHYNATGPEIYEQVKHDGRNLDAFIAGVGTGGVVMGVGKYLKEQNSNIKIHPLEPKNSPTLSTGYKVGRHRNDATVATIFTDDNKKYKSTDLFKKEAVKCDFLSKKIELISVTLID